MEGVATEHWAVSQQGNAGEERTGRLRGANASLEGFFLPLAVSFPSSFPNLPPERGAHGPSLQGRPDWEVAVAPGLGVGITSCI